MRLRGLGVWSVAAATGLCGILFLPLAPLPPCENVTGSATDLYATGYSVEWILAGPFNMNCRIMARVRGAGARGAGRLEVIGANGREILSMVLRPESSQFTSILTDPIDLKSASLRLRLREVEPPLGVDFIELRPMTGEPLRLEAENAKLSRDISTIISTEASGGIWIGSVPKQPVEDLEQTFRGTATSLSGITLNIGLPTNLYTPVAISLDDVTAHDRISELRCSAGQLPWKGQLVRLLFPPRAALTHEFRVTVKRDATAFTDLSVSPAGGYPDGQLWVNRSHLGQDLLFVPRYELPWRRIAGGAAGLVVFLVAWGWGRKDPRVILPLILLLLGGISMAYWQRDYQYAGSSHWIADGYDEYADRLHSVLRGSPGSLGRLKAFASDFPHAHSPLVPFLMSISSFIVPTVRGYLGLSYLSALVCGAALWRLLSEVPGAPRSVVWALWSVGMTHFLFIRIIARTSTDGFGYMLTVISLLLALRIARSEIWRTGELLLLTLTLLLGILARPTVVPLPPAVALGLLVVSWTTGRLSRRRLVTSLLVFVIPLAIFFAGIWFAGLWQTFALAQAKMALFADARTPFRFVVCIGVLVQALLIPLLASVMRCGRRPEVLMGLTWVCASVGFVVLTGTYWNRHFVPALPGLLLACLPGVALLAVRFPRSTRIATVAAAACNLFLLTVTLMRDIGFGAPYLFQ